MRLSYIREAPLLRASLLINQEKTKKGYKSIQPEISKMSEIFGSDFDKNLHKNLFDQIDFKETKTLLNSKSSETQYFIQEFPALLEREDFTNLFSEILMDTKNKYSSHEVYDGLNKIGKLSNENQLKILISFIFSGRDQFASDGKKMLINKCKEIQKESKFNQLSENTIQTLIFILHSLEEENKDAIELIEFIESNEEIEGEENTEIKDIEKIFDIGNEEQIEIEKIISEIPSMINSMDITAKIDFVNYELDERRLANFILFLIKHQNWEEDQERKQLNKIFISSIKEEFSAKFDDTTSDKKMQIWNLDNFYKMFKKNIDEMDANQIINAFDHPKFSIKDKKDFDFFINTLQKLKILTNANQFFNFIFTKWNNELNQIEFLSFLINNNIQNTTFSFKSYTGRKVKKSNDDPNSTLTKSSHLIDAWSCIDLIEVLFKLSKGNYYNKVKELFLWPMQNIPEILILALTSIKPENDEFLYNEIILEILPSFLTNPQSSLQMIEEIWCNNKDLIIRTLCNMYQSQPDIANLSRIFDFTQKLKDSFLLLVNCKDYTFAVNLAIFSSKKDKLDLDYWLKDRIVKSGDDFIEAIINYIKTNLISHCKGNSSNKQNILEKAQLSLESLANILENLINASGSPQISQRMKREIKEVYKTIFEIFDELQPQSTNSEEIEKYVYSKFQALFKGETTVNEIIDKLKIYQKSSLQRETDIFAHAIHCILDEFRFYHQYPERQLTIQATLFGQLINHRLFDGILETIALKYILESLKKGTGPMFLFGTIALSQFIDKLHLFPTYLSNLLELKQIKNSQSLYDKLVKKYNERANSVSKGENSNCSNRTESANKNKESIYITDNDEGKNEEVSKVNNSFTVHEYNEAKNGKIKTKLVRPPQQSTVASSPLMLGRDFSDSSIQSPPQEIVEQFKFIFKKMSKNNVNEKSKELKGLLMNDNIIKWFSNFFIVNRISSENNNHQIYNELITLIDNKTLNKILIKDTIFFIRKLLERETLLKDPKEKNALKNLGSWLGIITLSKNKPILAKDLDLKEIIFSAYEDGKLSAIINFIARIMEHSAKTKVFHPKNPWVQAIISLLCELLSKPDLKENLRLEIQNLFKKLDLDSSQYPPGKLLDNYKLSPNSPDFTRSQVFEVEMSMQANELYSKVDSLENFTNEITNVLLKANNLKGSNITRQEVVKILTRSLYIATKDLIEKIKGKYSEISIITTKVLLVKDFAFEKDELKFKQFACSCAKSLASSLCYADCWESLRNKVSDLLKKTIDDKIIEANLDKILNTNGYEFFDIGCGVIQSYQVQKVIDQIQKNPKIIEEIEKRKMNKQPEQKQSELLSKVQSLPEELRPCKSGLTEEQFKVYKNYNKIYDIFNRFGNDSKLWFLKKVNKMVKEAINHSNQQKIIKEYKVCMFNIQNTYLDRKPSFEEEDEQLICLEKLILNNNINNEEIASECAMLSLKYAIMASKNSIKLLLDVYSQLLSGWVKKHTMLSKKITESLLKNPEMFVRFNLELHKAFLKKDIFSIPDYEDLYIRFFENKSTCDIAHKLLYELNKHGVIKENLFNKIPSYMYNEYSDIFFSLFYKNSKIKLDFTTNANENNLLDLKISDSQDIAESKQNLKLFQDTIKDLKMSTFAFEKIQSNDLEKVKSYFENFPNKICSFIMMVTKEVLIEKGEEITFSPEGVANLIKKILELIQPNNNVTKLKILDGILYGIFKVFCYDYTKAKLNFNQRPYYRLLYNLIYLLDKYDNNEKIWGSGYKKENFFMSIADFLKNLSPRNYCGFSLAWLDLISSKIFVSNFLDTDTSKNTKEKIIKYEKYLVLVIEVLIFLRKIPNEIISHYSSKIFLDNVLKFLFLLCNSYPEFVWRYYFIILVSLPPGSCFIQMKNVILSCCPINIEIPDPRTEEITDIDAQRKNADILFEIQQDVLSPKLKSLIDSYVEDKNDAIVDEIIKILNKTKKENEEGPDNISGIVLYWSQSVLKTILERKMNSNFFMFDFYIKLMINLSEENRDHLINSILNELRYPSNQTYYFAYLLIHIFFEIKNENIEQHIMKNIAERLLYKPHPWGLVLMFLNLERDQKFSKMSKSYMSDDDQEKLLATCKDDK